MLNEQGNWLLKRFFLCSLYCIGDKNSSVVRGREVVTLQGVFIRTLIVSSIETQADGHYIKGGRSSRVVIKQGFTVASCMYISLNIKWPCV